MTALAPNSLAETRQLLGAWLTAVADVVRGVNTAEPLDTLLRRIAEQACRLAGFDLCAVMLVDPSGRWLQARGTHGLAPEYVARLNREHALVLRPGGAGLQRLAELLAEALHASITIEDVDDTVLAVAAQNPGEQATPAPDPAVRKRRSVLLARYEVVPIRRCGPGGPPAWVAPVVIGGQLVGRLWGTGIAAVPDPAQRRMIERFALVVAVQLLKQPDRCNWRSPSGTSSALAVLFEGSARRTLRFFGMVSHGT